MGNSFPPEPKIPRLFLDSSVIIAGLASRTGASHAILALAELGLIRPVGCPYILTEVERNLAKKVPEFLPAYRRLMVNLNWRMVEDPAAEHVSLWLDLVPAKDAPVLAAAVAAAPHRFITLDTRHFISPPEVAERSGLSICTPGGFLQEVRAILARGLAGEKAV
jgi:predicted nucleic acid-binding protein